MSQARRSRSLVASPILVGTVTVLVMLIAVFLSYNANSGLPFVPTYDVAVRVPDAEGLIRGNEVRVGGKRVGIVDSIGAVPGPDGGPVAELSLRLETTVQPLRDDSRVLVRPRSPLGLKYLELAPGDDGEPLPPGGTLPLAASKATVELDEALNAFDAATRRASQVTLAELGTGVTGRGADLNAFLDEAPRLMRGFERVAADLGDPETDLDGFVGAADRALSELAAAAPRLQPLVDDADATAGAFAAAGEQLGQAVEEAPATEAAAIRALSVARPVLRDAAALARDVRPGTRALPATAARIHSALETGTPVLRRATALAGRLGATLRAVEQLAGDPRTRRTLERLLAALASGEPSLRELAPLQTVCNYLGLWTRNVTSTISEGDAAGTWFRTLSMSVPDEAQARAEPAPNLHVNPYPNTAAPGQDGECEAGNEPYLPGQRIGNVPGHQGGDTEPTGPPKEVRGR